MTSTSASRARPAGAGRPVAVVDPIRRTAIVLSMVALVGMSVASALGLLFPAGYGEPESVAAMLRGYDLVTLVVAVPALAAMLIGLRRGWPNAEVVWLGVLAYGAYNYALYVFGAGFDDFFLLHVVAFGASAFALPLALSTVDPYALAGGLPGRVRSRIAAVVLGLLALGLSGMWVVASLRYAVTGELPAGSALVETDAVVHTGIALDLALLVPAYLTAAVLLWRRTGWGFVAGAAVLLSGLLHQLSYGVALSFQAAADVPGAQATDPGEVWIVLAYLVAIIALLALPTSSPSGRAARSQR